MKKSNDLIENNKKVTDILLQLPDAQTLKQCFREANFIDLAEKTSLISQLAEERIFLLEIQEIVNKSLDDYANYTAKESKLVEIMYMLQDEIFLLIIKNCIVIVVSKKLYSLKQKN